MTQKKRNQTNDQKPLSSDEIEQSIRDMLSAEDCVIEKHDGSLIYKIKTTKSGQKRGKSVTVEEINKLISNNGFVLKDENKDKKIYVLYPEKAYVRRTSAEFEAGAKPVSGKSHHMKNVGLSLSEDLQTAAKEAARKEGVPFTMWMRAAMRKALRDGMDAKYELETEVAVSSFDTPER